MVVIISSHHRVELCNDTPHLTYLYINTPVCSLADPDMERRRNAGSKQLASKLVSDCQSAQLCKTPASLANQHAVRAEYNGVAWYCAGATVMMFKNIRGWLRF